MIPPLKIWRSFACHFGHGVKAHPNADLDDESIRAEVIYDDAELARIASEGFTGIWVQAILRHIVSVAPFPELGGNAQHHQSVLTRLVERAGRYGLKVWLYVQPPRAVPISWTEFWDKHPDVGGVEEVMVDSAQVEPTVTLRSLCTSTPRVKQWLVNASAELAGKLPGLAGIIVITASEFNSHCYSHRTRYEPKEWLPTITCARCQEREPEDVVAEVINLLERGIRSVSEQMEVVAWNWSWCWRSDSYQRVIERLPERVILLADFERGGIRDIPGRNDHVYDEYSLGYAGPSERFLTCAASAKAHGLRVMAKLQLGTTHELATVVNLPIIGSLYEKAAYITREALSGFMGCWNFGNYPSANTAAFLRFFELGASVGKEKALEDFALDYFPGCNAKLVRQAWEQFEKAMRWYPFTIAFLYYGVHSHALAYYQVYKKGSLEGGTAGPGWMPFAERGDDLSKSFMLHDRPFSLDEIIERLEKLAELWTDGTEMLKKGLLIAKETTVAQELGNALICGAVWQSTAHAYRVYRLRLDWSDCTASSVQSIAVAELKILSDVLPLVEADSRQGIHLEPGVAMFSPKSIRHKIAVLEALINESNSTRARTIPAEEYRCPV